jgi:hypothetical protein
MAVVGSTIMIDFHLTENGDLETVRGAVRQGERAHPVLVDRVQRVVEQQAHEALAEQETGDYQLSTSVELVAGRVPGAPRERLTAALDFEGEEPVLASIDDAVTAPDRARIADELEAAAKEYLRENDLTDAVDVTVSVTPIQFR